MGIQNVQSLTPLLQVYDMQRSVAWYRDVLGFQVMSTYEPDGHLYWATLQLGGAVLMLNARYEDDERPPSPPPAQGREDTTLFFLCENVDAAYAELSNKAGRVSAPETAFYGMRQMEVIDPDGFVLCFQHPVGPELDH